MRISDWSSDVCSSDLIVVALAGYPDGIASEVGAHLNSSKTETAEANGAIGLLTLPTLARMKNQPWEMIRHKSEERRVRKEWVSSCYSRWSTSHKKKKINTK